MARRGILSKLDERMTLFELKHRLAHARANTKIRKQVSTPRLNLGRSTGLRLKRSLKWRAMVKLLIGHGMRRGSNSPVFHMVFKKHRYSLPPHLKEVLRSVKLH